MSKNIEDTHRKPAQLFLVETFQTFHMHYLVESETAETAKSTLQAMLDTPDVREWQQKYVGETIFHTRAINRLEAEQMHQDEEHDGSPWMPLDSMILRSNNGV